MNNFKYMSKKVFLLMHVIIEQVFAWFAMILLKKIANGDHEKK